MDKKNKIKYVIGMLMFVFVVVALSLNIVSADVSQTVCCEKTLDKGLFCQESLPGNCNTNYRQAPTACRSTSFCKLGVCYDSEKGTCSSNTAQLVCNNNNGTWSQSSPAQCSLGCCVLGDQAAFVTLVRCKKLATDLGLQPNFNSGITDEVQCILTVQNQDKGACVFEKEFEKTCKFTTRAECANSALKGTFYKDKLCSAEELGTNCKKTKETRCVDGKDEVYFVDSCGNTANIYDASKIDNLEYWTNLKTKSESCNANDVNGNAGSKSCGNCDYLNGGYCRASTTLNRATYGDNICSNLNCAKTQNGKSYSHGESWCVFNDKGDIGGGSASVGSRFYKHICINGEEVLEQCADYRQEECIENKISVTVGTTQKNFAQAACRVNRWQDCLGQSDKIDCENRDRRDCVWKAGDFKISNEKGNANLTGICVPNVPPGLKFWGDTPMTDVSTTIASLLSAKESADYSNEAKQICAQATFSCRVGFEKSLFGDEKCKDNCECWDSEKKAPSAKWIAQNAEICKSLGDCGPKVNWLNVEGYRDGYQTTTKKIAEEAKSGGGLFG